MKWFREPRENIGDLDADIAGQLVAAASDIALVLDVDGRIIDVALATEHISEQQATDWIGRTWSATVSAESQGKVDGLLKAALSGETPRWRQVNHPLGGRSQLAVSYCALQAGHGGHVIAIGRDLQAIANLQQRLVEVQQSLERDYWQLRQTEARYRLLFQIASEPVLVVDANNRRVLEANPAAQAMLSTGKPDLVGQMLLELFQPECQERVARQLETVIAVGVAEDIQIQAQNADSYLLSIALLRQQTGETLLLHLAPADRSAADRGTPDEDPRLLQLLDSAPDGIIVTDQTGTVLHANRSFLDLAQVANSRQVEGESLGRWLGRQGIDLDVLLANLRQHPSIRLFPTTIRGEHGSLARVEVSATVARSAAGVRFGFFLRNVDTRPPGDRDSELDQPRSMEQVTQLVGQVPLRDLVRESTDLIERLCIEAALRLTGDNRASAAEILGLSRQSLYVKLRRHGLMDGETGSPA